MPTNTPPLRLPVRGSRCVDWWNAPDLNELADIRQLVAAFDMRTVVIAAELQREERQARKQREREKVSQARCLPARASQG